MKKSILALSILLFFSFTLLSAQSNNLGWYHLLSGAKTKILVNYNNPNQDGYYASDEILLLFDIKGEKGYAIDVDGRIVEIQDTSGIKKIDTVGRVVKITKQVNLSLNKKLQPDNNVWLVGFNSANNTAKILLSSGEIAEIPNDSYTDLRTYFEANGRKYKIRDVVTY